MSSKFSGVYKDTKKDGSANCRSSFTWKNKHVSLGSYSDEKSAADAYQFALKLMSGNDKISDYKQTCPLIFSKYVTLCNLRDNNLYISNPIYLENRYFTYHISPEEAYKFDMDDLFYFSSHKIMKRGNHLFVSDYGMQVSLNDRYGIRPFAVLGRDYLFINGDNLDYRRENIEIINRFYGVTKIQKKNTIKYKAVIHINGNVKIGEYNTEIEAAIAYNKATDIVKKRGIEKKYPQNYIEGISAKEYADIYSSIILCHSLQS